MGQESLREARLAELSAVAEAESMARVAPPAEAAGARPPAVAIPAVDARAAALNRRGRESNHQRVNRPNDHLLVQSHPHRSESTDLPTMEKNKSIIAMVMA